MRINKSPWIHQLDHDRKRITLQEDLDTDVAIVGAGIAGVSTAFFLLKYTNQRVVILEQGKLAHGATGHNAGQVVAHFERPLEELVKEFGFEKTKDALHDLQSGWALIEEMYNDANLHIFFSKTIGKLALSDLNQVLIILKDAEIEKASGIHNRQLLISEETPFLNLIPKVYENYYKIVSKKQILEMLESKDGEFHGIYLEEAACINSALFCQEIVNYLFKKYPDRFSLYEDTKILKTVLKKNHALLDAVHNVVNASRVVLCTNGFENIEILNEGGLEINKWFHHSLEGSVGYMSGYLEKMNKPSIAIGYYTEDIDPSANEPYFYMTRRPHDLNDEKQNLICLGGPELKIKDRAEYMIDYDYPDHIQADLDTFINKVYDAEPNKKIDYQFTWHGLMGYTPNRVRLIGKEPKNPTLLYNLGCNGIGIIPSVFGGRRIARIIAGEKMRPSMFDPRVEEK